PSAGGDGGVRLRTARPADLPPMGRIERASFSLPWSETAFRSVMRRDDARLIVADRGGEVAGYAAVWFAADEAELGDIAVDPDRRREGIGSRLVREVVAEARRRGVQQIFLQVRESNRGALRLYESAGFRRVGRRAGYYRSPSEDALVLLLPVRPRPAAGPA
ncbi:MAG: ribosomal protein S18-alanine N-acetyltransferase, partial [Gemmatimonadota bacterium]